MQVDPATIADNGWDMEFDRFWGPVSCDGLYLIFDCVDVEGLGTLEYYMDCDDDGEDI